MDYSIIVMIVLVVVMYLVMFLPQKKREKAVKQMRIVVTEAGIVGRVISAKDLDTVTIETGSDKTRLKIKRWAVLSKEEQQ